jgi:hypothetical protein
MVRLHGMRGGRSSDQENDVSTTTDFGTTPALSAVLITASFGVSSG